MTFRNDTFDRNVMYGLDTHDVTTDLDVEGNHFTHNGDHGFICSQRCDSLTVVGNESAYNGEVPWPARTRPVTAQGGQVHGIMLHRGITNTVVANNNVHDQPNGAGIAIFDTSGQTITEQHRDQEPVRHPHLRRVREQRVQRQHRPRQHEVRRLHVQGQRPGREPDQQRQADRERLHGQRRSRGSQVAALNLTDTDGTRFDGNAFGGGAIKVGNSAGTRIAGGVTTGQSVTATGSSAVPCDVKLVDADLATSSTIADAYSKENITSSAGRIYLVQDRALQPDGDAVRFDRDADDGEDRDDLSSRR